MELKIFEHYLHLQFDEKVLNEKWHDLKDIRKTENFILSSGNDERFFFLLKPSFSSEDFEYLRELFQQKMV